MGRPGDNKLSYQKVSKGKIVPKGSGIIPGRKRKEKDRGKNGKNANKGLGKKRTFRVLETCVTEGGRRGPTKVKKPMSQRGVLK